MLNLIYGISDSPKREYLNNLISEAIDAGKKAVLIVPEQSAFERERDYTLSAGAVKANKLIVTGFSRMIRTLLDDTGLRMKTQADDAAKNVLMSLACDEVAGELSIYKTHSKRPGLVAGLLTEYGEIRRAGLTVKDTADTAALLPDGSLKIKLTELSAIFAAYEALLCKDFSNDDDNIPATTEYLKNHRFFEGWAVFIDDFRGVTGVQLQLIEQIIAQADEVYVSVKAEKGLSEEGSDAFDHSRKFISSLKLAARRQDVAVKALPETPFEEHDPVKEALRKNFYAVNQEKYNDETDRIVICSAGDKYEECRLVAVMIKQLLENEGLRCRDIAVIERGDEYLMPMTTALRRYGIPVFRDRSAPMTGFPVSSMLLRAVKIAAGGADTEDILAYIKCGMTGLTDGQLAALESYVYVWQLDSAKDWEKEFTQSPDGFSNKTDEKTLERLRKINESRSAVISPIVTLRNRLYHAEDGKESCLALWNFLEETKASSHFLRYAKKLNDAGDKEGALLMSDVWDKLMNVLDALSKAISDRRVDAKRLAELLEIMLTSTTVGKIPVGIDEITIGKADRIRLIRQKAVFLVGVNKNVFPADITNSGLFTINEKKSLEENGFVLESTPESAFDEERLVTYSAVTSAAEKLIISYSMRRLTGEALEPSEIVDEIAEIFTNCKKLSTESFPVTERIGSPFTVFTEYAAACSKNDEKTAALKAYCEENPATAGFVPAVDRAVKRLPVSFESSEIATELFGETMTISASKAESYNECPFNYFIRYGLGIKPDEIARVDNRIRGNMIHEVLELLLKKFSKQEFLALTPDELKQEATELSEQYITDWMGGRDGKDATTLRAFDNAEFVIYDIVARMQNEFANSGFEFSDMELSIGEKDDDDAKPYEIPLEDGGMIKIIGKVDRIDRYHAENGEYIRIVDYKSGSKDFKLGELLTGHNLQMPIYLYSVLRGSEKYKDCLPAGFLYLPAKADDNETNDLLDRSADEESVTARRLELGKMFGVVVEDPEIIEASNPGMIKNLKINKNGNYSDGTLSPKALRGLEKQVSSTIADIGMRLHRGEIEALPHNSGSDSKSSKKLPCQYCKYGSICLREDDDETRKTDIPKPADTEEILKTLAEED